mmetsp:Transcript_31060/g.98608  ORF Transcript_31060/g.98608 Transcript_31060/m.98608 type:complete len:457 (+) Transcript_31060:541-1911(+)
MVDDDEAALGQREQQRLGWVRRQGNEAPELPTNALVPEAITGKRRNPRLVPLPRARWRHGTPLNSHLAPRAARHDVIRGAGAGPREHEPERQRLKLVRDVGATPGRGCLPPAHVALRLRKHVGGAVVQRHAQQRSTRLRECQMHDRAPVHPPVRAAEHAAEIGGMRECATLLPCQVPDEQDATLEDAGGVRRSLVHRPAAHGELLCVRRKGKRDAFVDARHLRVDVVHAATTGAPFVVPAVPNHKARRHRNDGRASLLPVVPFIRGIQAGPDSADAVGVAQNVLGDPLLVDAQREERPIGSAHDGDGCILGLARARLPRRADALGLLEHGQLQDRAGRVDDGIVEPESLQGRLERPRRARERRPSRGCSLSLRRRLVQGVGGRGGQAALALPPRPRLEVENHQLAALTNVELLAGAVDSQERRRRQHELEALVLAPGVARRSLGRAGAPARCRRPR